MAYLEMEPPDQGDNYRSALMLAQITNMSGRSLPEGKRVKPDDFLGNAEKQVTAAQSENDQKVFMQSLRSE
jgi:hypothetical protein